VTRLHVMAALLLSLAATPCATAGELQPICRVPSVLDVMAREVRQHDYYASLEPYWLAEAPDTVNTVWCWITVWTHYYDARVPDMFPLWHWEQYVFRVKALSKGFLVDYRGRSA